MSGLEHHSLIPVPRQLGLDDPFGLPLEVEGELGLPRENPNLLVEEAVEPLVTVVDDCVVVIVSG